MFVHGGYDFLGVIHICVVACAFLLGSTLRARIRFFQEYLIPAPMIGGVFLFLFYNFAAGRLGLTGGKQFLEAMMFHLLNISFIAMQLRMPVHTKLQRNARVKQNVCALMAEYGMQGFFGLLAVILVFNKRYAGAARSLGLTLCLGFELGPGQAESLAKVWEGAPYNVYNAGNVGLAMAAIGFVIGSVVGVFLINRAARKGWLSYEYVDQLKHRKAGNGFFKRKQDRVPSSFQTTSSDTMDSFTLHIALIMFAYMLSYLFLSGVEYLVAKYVGGKPLEVVKGFWGINFIVSSLFARLERWFLIVTHSPHVVDNATCNRIDGIAVDFMVIACLGAIEVVTIKTYWLLILVLTFTGIIITCYITPWFCSRLFGDFSFMRFLMIFGTANGTLPTALSLLRVVDPNFETQVAQDYIGATGFMFILALPILALINWPAMGHTFRYLCLLAGYMIVAFVMYVMLAGKRAFAEPRKYFFMEKKQKA